MATKEWTPEEQKEHRKLWVEALRSGRYEQGASYLKRTDGSWCCLGVACDVSGLGEWQVSSQGHYSAYIVGDEESDNDLPNTVRNWLGLASSEGLYDGGGERGGSTCLSAQNDNYGRSFTYIADVIEAEPEGLVERSDVSAWHIADTDVGPEGLIAKAGM